MKGNPIFPEYYSHEGCECYKILNPFTEYAEEKIVLCRVDEGIERAKCEASRIIHVKLKTAMERT